MKVRYRIIENPAVEIAGQPARYRVQIKRHWWTGWEWLRVSYMDPFDMRLDDEISARTWNERLDAEIALQVFLSRYQKSVVLEGAV